MEKIALLVSTFLLAERNGLWYYFIIGRNSPNGLCSRKGRAKGMAHVAEHEEFDLKLARECAQAFSGASGIGCVISDAQGRVLGEYGYGCMSCGLCAAAREPKDHCVQAQIYGMTEAERFGGKYIYYCPMGLTCFVSPILGEVKSAAKITVGPFLMVERQDYVDCELLGLTPETKTLALEVLESIPTVPPARVNQLSTLLFLAVGFLNNVSASNRMLDAQASDAIQGQITSYIMRLKEGEAPPYPIETEKALLRSIAKADRLEANRLLNELQGHILFSTGRNFSLVKTRIYELLVLIGRAAIDAGANPGHTLDMSRDCLEKLPSMQNIEELCLWLSEVTNEYMDSVFRYADARHANAIHRCTQYIEAHYAEKISLEQLAGMVFLSPPYLSRIFKEETGASFNAYLNRVRIEKSKELLRHGGLRLADIAGAVGFEDQSYFTKVFKRAAGDTPNHYRDRFRQRE